METKTTVVPQVTQITPATADPFIEWSLGSLADAPYYITCHGNKVYFTEHGSDKIGLISP